MANLGSRISNLFAQDSFAADLLTPFDRFVSEIVPWQRKLVEVGILDFPVETIKDKFNKTLSHLSNHVCRNSLIRVVTLANLLGSEEERFKNMMRILMIDPPTATNGRSRLLRLYQTEWKLSADMTCGLHKAGIGCDASCNVGADSKFKPETTMVDDDLADDRDSAEPVEASLVRNIESMPPEIHDLIRDTALDSIFASGSFSLDDSSAYLPLLQALPRRVTTKYLDLLSTSIFTVSAGGNDEYIQKCLQRVPSNIRKVVKTVRIPLLRTDGNSEASHRYYESRGGEFRRHDYAQANFLEVFGGFVTGCEREDNELLEVWQLKIESALRQLPHVGNLIIDSGLFLLISKK